MLKKHKFFSAMLIALALVLTVSAGIRLYAAYVGQVVSSIQLQDPNWSPKAIPYIGERVVSIMYTDPDAKDVNDPLSDAINAKKYPKSKYVAIGIANCKETFWADGLIASKTREKQAQFPEAIFLLDKNRTLANAWQLGNGNGTGIVILIGKDKKIKFISYVKNQGQSKAIINDFISTLDAELKK